MPGRSLKTALTTALAALTIAAPGQASDGTWGRAWGKDVDSSLAGAGFEICTVAANCQAGGSGGRGGELYDPFGLAADASGNVYVADTNNYRVEKFDSSGNFLRAWGQDVDQGGGTGFEVCTVASSCQAGVLGTQGGEFNFPEGIAVDGSGNVYVTDFSNNRVQVFDGSGGFLGAWGKNVDSAQAGTGFEVCSNAADCQAGSPGGLGGELNAPTGVAVDTIGNVYVSDRDNQRIQKLNSSGGFLRAWGKDVDQSGGTEFEVCTVASSCKAGLPGVMGGELQVPQGLAIGAAGDVYVADTGHHRVQRYDSSGSFVSAWGSNVSFSDPSNGPEICIDASDCQTGSLFSSQGGEFASPYGVATDSAGDVYIADSANQRIQKLEPDGGFLRAWGKDVDTAQSGTGYEICVLAPSCKNGDIGVLGGEFHVPAGVATDAAGNVYVVEHDNRRVQKFTSDTTPPETTIESGPSGPTDDATPTFTFSSNEPGSSFACSVDGAAFKPCSGPGASHTTASLGDGAHTFAVRASDPTGNPDPIPATRAFTVDTKAPETTITKRPKDKSVKRKAKYKFRSSDPGSSFECKIDKKDFQPCTSPKRFRAKKGKHRFQVRATDAAGNIDPTPAKDKFKVIEK